MQILLVGQDGHGLRAEEIRVPHAEQSHQHGQIAREGRRAEVLIHLVKASEQLAEVLRPDGEHRRQADRRVHRVAPADPVPELEHVRGVDAELRAPPLHWWRRPRSGGRLPALSPSRPCSNHARAARALVIVSSVVKVFEETMNSVSRRIEIAHGFGEVGAIDVGYEAERHGALAVRLERLVGHHGAEIRAADADVDDVADALARVSFPVAAADAVRKVAHPGEHRVDLRHHVLAIHDERMRPSAHAAPCAAPPGSRRR